MKLLLCVFLVFMLAGCNGTPPVEEPPPLPPPVERIVVQREIEHVSVENTLYLQPVTVALIEELGMHEAVSNFQYYLSNPLVLISAGSGVARGSNNRGTLELTNDFASDIIVIHANTRGEVINIWYNAAGNTVLEVCFEPGNPDAGLLFVETGAEGYFYLGTVAGSTRYKNARYLVQEEVGSLARLLIGVENYLYPIVPRQLPGREIDEHRANTPVDFPLSQPLSRSDSYMPESQEILKIQLGAFTSADNAQKAINSLSAAGFMPVYEKYNEYYRVIIYGELGDLAHVSRQLESVGFTDMWVR